MRRLPIIISSGLLAFAALAVVTQAGETPSAVAQTPAEQQPAPQQEGTITVQGTASVDVVPDRAQLWIGVESRGATARAALAANAADMRKVLTALRAAGASDLQTQHVGLSQRYLDGGRVDGYTASNSVSATVRQLAQAGAVIDAAVAAGANQISGPSLTRADTAALYRQALEAAVENARGSAEALAKASHLSLGKVTAVVEGGGAPAPMPLAARAADESASPPFEAGKQQVTATVTVTFAAS